MEPLVLVVNPGSSSREYAIFQAGRALISGYYEQAGDKRLLTVDDGDATEISGETFDNAFSDFLSQAATRSEESIAAIGMRLVAPGRRFLEHRLLDDDLYAYLQDNIDKAPLHIGAELAEINQIKQVLPETPIYLISDSAFHHSLSHEARNYAIPKADADAYDIYRYGFHGISVKSVVHRLREELNQDYPRLIVCHLGSGASITAIRDWKSIETSMGYSPLEGLVMATRSGSIDVKAAIELKKQKNMSDDELIDYLNHQSGLLGLSGSSNDIRQLLELETAGDEDAKFALDAMVYRIRSYLGAYIAILGGIDAIVFTATVGERSTIIRRRICESVSHLGVELDTYKNDTVVSEVARISKDSSPVAVHVIPTNEPAEIARQTLHMVAHK